MNDLLKEMNERLKYLESIEQTDENIARIKEITLAIVRVQQIVLDELTKTPKVKVLAEELKQKAIETYLKYGNDKALVIKGKRTYTGNEIVYEIINGTDFGIDIVNKIMQLSIDLLKRDKVNLPTPFTPIPAEDEAKILARMYGLANGFEADIQSAIIDQQNTINSLKAHGVDTNYEEKVLAILKSM